MVFHSETFQMNTISIANKTVATLSTTAYPRNRLL